MNLLQSYPTGLQGVISPNLPLLNNYTHNLLVIGLAEFIIYNTNFSGGLPTIIC